MEQSLLLWGFGLLVAALFLILLEVFVPSGGLIGLSAGVCAMAAVVNFWRVSTTWGLTSLLVVLVLAPIAINFALRLMPHTPMGKRLILTSTQADSERQAAIEQQKLEQEQTLVGAVGLALTPLRPVGTIDIEGTKLEALAEGGAVEAGQRIRVTSVQGNQIKVRSIA